MHNCLVLSGHADTFKAFSVPGIVQVVSSIIFNQLTGTFIGQIVRQKNPLKFQSHGSSPAQDDSKSI